MNSKEPIRIVVLVSGNGSNLQALIDACEQGRINGRIAGVISNRPQVFALERARRHHIPAFVLDHRRFPDRAHFDESLRKCIDALTPDLIVLAGFMRILTPAFVDHYLGRMLNIHPSLLPAYPGLHTHARALADGAIRHGASVHFVTRELDGGPVIVQAEVPIAANDTPDSLAARVQLAEHRIYPLAVAWFAEGRLQLADGAARLDEKPIVAPTRLKLEDFTNAV